MKYEKGSFITVPNQAQIKGIDPKAQCLYMWLCFHANQDGECFPSRRLLMDETGMGLTSVKDAIKTLEEVGVIKATRRKNGKENLTNFYEIMIGGVGRNTTYLGREATDPVGRNTTSELNPLSLTQSNEQRGKPRTPREWTNKRREELGKEPLVTRKTKKQEDALEKLLVVDRVVQLHRKMAEGEGEDYSFMDSDENPRIRQQIARVIPKVLNQGKTMEDFIEYIRNNEWARSVGYNPMRVYTDSMVVDFAIGKVIKKKKGREVRRG